MSLIPRLASLRSVTRRYRNCINGNGKQSRLFSTAVEPPIDYFEVIGIQRTFETSPEELKQLYREKMKEMHPDKHTLKPLEERELVAEKTSEMTMAYNMLKDDYERALHLLELKGHPIEDNLSGNILGAEFLMQVMSIREEVEESKSNEDLSRQLQENKIRISEAVEDLAAAFDQDDFHKAKCAAVSLNYWKRIEETVKDKMTSVP
mmetsp:Transcript_6433/g.9420  ORF Transcript_6433/g.9420 Transcript_6433/m.9420 type:complete len:206 (-) Transcript_6433:127-744(-)